MARNKNVQETETVEVESSGNLTPALVMAQKKRQEIKARREGMTQDERDTEDIREATQAVIDRMTNGRNDFATVARRVLVHTVRRRDTVDESGNVIQGKNEEVGTVSRARIEKAFNFIEDALRLAKSRVFSESADEDDSLDI